MKHIAALFSLILAAHLAPAQITIGDTLTPEQLVQDLLLGQEITVSNVMFNGVPGAGVNEQAGNFGAGGNVIGMGSGVILATGSVLQAVGPNNTGASSMGGQTGFGDPDLTQLTGISTYDAAALQFDFIPAGDSVWFRFAFASDEYPEFVCAGFNDGFGFFLSGPGIVGPYMDNSVNLALVPGTTVPITINTVNAGVPGAPGNEGGCASLDPNWFENSVYYIGDTDSALFQFDGQTVVFQLHALVMPNETHHLKISIADSFDDNYDSALFLEAGSFSSLAPMGVADRRVSPRPILRPDAANGVLWVEGDPQGAVLVLFDGTGRVVLQERITGRPVDIGGLHAGHYIARMQLADGAVVMARFVAEGR